MRYALIDNCSGFVWWVGDADTPAAACYAADMECGGIEAAYEEAGQHDLAGNETGYFVYAAPAGFDVIDGQDEDEIRKVDALPLVGVFRRIDAE